jgi:hypothetical protein
MVEVCRHNPSDGAKARASGRDGIDGSFPRDQPAKESSMPTWWRQPRCSNAYIRGLLASWPDESMSHRLIPTIARHDLGLARVGSI